jgi:short-subunit dehydrogenase
MIRGQARVVPFPSPDPAATALVTGASSGIGAEFARRLAELGYGVTLVARREDRLHELARELRLRHPVRTEVIPCDLTDPAARDALVDRLAAAGLRVDVLVNAAGFATGGPLRDTPREDELAQVHLLCEAPVDLTRRYLPAMVERGSGAVITVASTAAMQPLPHSAGYSAAKAHALAFTEAVHAEVRRHGVHVTALCPPPVHTELFEKADHPVERVPRIAWLEPGEVVRIGLDGARRNKRVVVPKPLARLQALISRHAPHAIGLPLVERAFRTGRG